MLLAAPDAVLPEKFLLIGMMSKAWATRHGVMLPQDFNAKQETHAVRNANGTGPYRLVRYEPDNRLVLAAHEGWWGPRGDVEEATWLVIQSDATRLAALASGEVDLLLDPPFQDVARLKREGRFKVIETSDIGTQYLGFDQWRAEPEFSDLNGRNPFKDLRVRRAIAHAIDVDAIVAKVLRGQAAVTGSHVSKLVDGYVPALEQRPSYDPAAARALLKDAGYADGFGITLDCVNIAWRAAVCQAIAGMLAQVGIRVTFQPSPAPQFFPKLTQATTSFFEVGWTPATDAWPLLNALVRSFGDGVRSSMRSSTRFASSRTSRAGANGWAKRLPSCTPTCRCFHSTGAPWRGRCARQSKQSSGPTTCSNCASCGCNRMNMHRFAFPTAIHFGAGAASAVGPHLREQGRRRPLVVTDRMLAALPVARRFVDALRQAGLDVASSAAAAARHSTSQRSSAYSAPPADRRSNTRGITQACARFLTTRRGSSRCRPPPGRDPRSAAPA